ncbi:amidohydrolase [Bacteroidota bacterium]
MINIALIQPDIIWEDVDANLDSYTGILKGMDSKVDVIIMPELFTTGFTMRSRDLAEPMEGKTMAWMSAMSDLLQCDLVGSIIIEEQDKFFNRLVWMQQDNSYHYYDKHHLFRMSGENEYYAQGKAPVNIQTHGVRFRPLVCYDLRFPVWSRNRQDYDVLLYIANWPAVRGDVWRTLLKARAIENQAYTIGVNRVGKDGMGIEYIGDTMAFDAKGNEIIHLESGKPGMQTISLSLEDLIAFRNKFPVWKDADPFALEY